MAEIRTEDRPLFTAAEWALIESSGPSRVDAYAPKQLQDRITRTRRVVDKYRDLTRAQQRSTKESPKRPSFSLRTRRKLEVFTTALQRFERRLARLTKEESRKSGRRGKPISNRSGSPISQGEALRRKKQQRQAANDAALAPRVTRQFQKSKMRAIQGHLSARGKRRQAKRDAQ